MFEHCSVDDDHVVLLQKLDKLILSAESLEVDLPLRRRMYALRNLLVIHASKTQSIREDIANALATNRKRVLLLGAATVAAIAIPYVLLTRTSFLHSPFACETFKTRSTLYPGEVQVCVNGVTRSYSRLNGDVELDLTFMQSPRERVQADVVFWIADLIAEKKVDYKGEYNIDRVRIYDNGWLVSDDREKASAWTRPLVPADVQIPLWKWVYSLRNTLARDRVPHDERLEELLARLGPFIATIGSVLVTAWRFYQAR